MADNSKTVRHEGLDLIFWKKAVPSEDMLKVIVDKGIALTPKDGKHLADDTKKGISAFLNAVDREVIIASYPAELHDVLRRIAPKPKGVVTPLVGQLQSPPPSDGQPEQPQPAPEQPQQESSGGGAGQPTSRRGKNESEEAYQARMAREQAAQQAAVVAQAVALELARAATIAAQAKADAEQHRRDAEKEAARNHREERRVEARIRHDNRSEPTSEVKARIDQAIAMMKTLEKAGADEAERRRQITNSATTKHGMSWFGKSMIGFAIFMAVLCGGFGILLVSLFSTGPSWYFLGGVVILGILMLAWKHRLNFLAWLIAKLIAPPPSP